MDNGNATPRLLWDMGTGYDLFASLHVLHQPAKFGVRGAWAAGVRSRLTQEERDILEELFELVEMPFRWVYSLPEPKDSATVLYNLKQIPAKDRIFTLSIRPGSESPISARVQEVAARGAWDEDDRRFLIDAYRERAQAQKGHEAPTPRQIEKILTLCARVEEVGEQFLEALESYYDVFFAEEEKRIAPKLKEAVEQAQSRLGQLPFTEWFEELSRGVSFEDMGWAEELTLVPSYWLTPLILGHEINDTRKLMLFGARPTGESLVPGEIVPDDLLLALKALADPTRLRILRYLMQENLTPAELSRRLRLRAPTVTHHLHTLRLAGLVRFMIKGKQERLYSARIDTIKANYILLRDFLETDEGENEPIETFERGRVF